MNTISGNGRYGIYLESVDYDLIYFNTLAGNPVNAKQAFSINNTWDNGMYGNYWDDYLTLHPEANSSNGNTWNTPYAIDDAQDMHPLIFPGGASDSMPVISTQDDVTFVAGYAGYAFSWIITDDTVRNGTFEIYEQQAQGTTVFCDYLFMTGTWTSGTNITITVNGSLTHDRIYFYRILVSDGYGLIASDTVAVIITFGFSNMLDSIITGVIVVSIAVGVVIVAWYVVKKRGISKGKRAPAGSKALE